MKRIKDLEKIKRPREKLLEVGIENLEDFELLALIIGSGTKKQNALTLSKQILKNSKNKNLEELLKIEGIGLALASKIVASVELGKRLSKQNSLSKILSPNDVLREVLDIRNKSREYLVALFLNARHELVDKQVISIGSLNQNVIEPRDIFSVALALPSQFIILVHNHPSNDPTPSEEDILFTKKLVKAGKILGCRIIDHIIVTKDDFTSLKELKFI